MSILLDRSTRVLVHGVSGPVGAYQLERMREYGTQVVAAVSRSREPAGVTPLFEDVATAVRQVRPDLMVTYAPGPHVSAPCVQAFDAGVSIVVAVAENVPMRDVIRMRLEARRLGTVFIGPNTNGILTPGQARVGYFSPEIGSPGPVGVISRSGTLSYGAMLELAAHGLGESTVVGIGGGLARGTSAVEVLRLFNEDPQTDVVVYLGESGSDEEEQLALEVAQGRSKPVVALIVGDTLGDDSGYGHAGAIVLGGRGGPESKRAVLAAAGVSVVPHLGALGARVRDVLGVLAGSKAAAIS